MPRFSIIGLMGLVLVTAVTLAALRSEFWAGVLLMLTLALIGLAVLALILLEGRDALRRLASRSSRGAI